MNYDELQSHLDMFATRYVDVYEGASITPYMHIVICHSVQLSKRFAEFGLTITDMSNQGKCCEHLFLCLFWHYEINTYSFLLLLSISRVWGDAQISKKNLGTHDFERRWRTWYLIHTANYGIHFSCVSFEITYWLQEKYENCQCKWANFLSNERWLVTLKSNEDRLTTLNRWKSIANLVSILYNHTLH